MREVYRIIRSERHGMMGLHVVNATYSTLEQAKDEAEKIIFGQGLPTSEEVIIVKEVLRARPKTYWE